MYILYIGLTPKEKNHYFVFTCGQMSLGIHDSIALRV